MNKSSDTPVPGTKAVAVTQHHEGSAPQISAKGHGYVAEKILDIAFAEGVKVRQDTDLVELLDAFDVDCPVPLEALHAVSQILDRVYAENRQLEESAPAPKRDVIDAVVATTMTDTDY
ncbi:EscU/YscU/HrcU family type III secretion system export apparatus switch protein [Kordiimonas sp.]|uniref:EscU/YscU/HrcU family type III secretion system export apparatus switch protein n=1 Tax=Kordiimonas sp. TaxID=1970157 RepID=UPI003A95A677